MLSACSEVLGGREGRCHRAEGGAGSVPGAVPGGFQELALLMWARPLPIWAGASSLLSARGPARSEALQLRKSGTAAGLLQSPREQGLPLQQGRDAPSLCTLSPPLSLLSTKRELLPPQPEAQGTARATSTPFLLPFRHPSNCLLSRVAASPRDDAGSGPQPHLSVSLLTATYLTLQASEKPSSDASIAAGAAVLWACDGNFPPAGASQAPLSACAKDLVALRVQWLHFLPFSGFR